MKVINIHKRTINQPISKVARLMKTLSYKNDSVWPIEKWFPMKFKEGIKVGAKGGHGPIRYSVEVYNPNKLIQFRFSNPKGFNGIHKFELKELKDQKTEIIHTIDMNTKGKGTLIWLFAIHSLHNALIEDGFDRMENILSTASKKTEWNLWVKIIRKLIYNKRKRL